MLRFLGLLFFLTLIVGVVAAYGYGNLQVRFSGVQSVTLEVKTDAGSLTQATLHLIVGDVTLVEEAG